MTSTAAVIAPSAVLTSLSEMIPRRTSENCERICLCWSGGKASMTRSIVCAALFVCRVERTRWPVSAAVSTVCIVSTSRISPTMITSGSWRNEFFSASRKLGVSVPTSRCEMAAVLSWKRNSIGSSMVTMCSGSLSETCEIIAASVVDLPEPVGPVTSTRPSGMAVRSLMTCGSSSWSMVRIWMGMRRKTAPTVPRCM